MKDRKLLNIELGRVSPEEYRALPESGMVVVLDNIRSAHNVGSAFRTADAWEHVSDTLEAIARLKEAGYTIVAVEQTVHSVGLDAFRPVPGSRYALVFGNEVEGVRQDVVDASDMSLEIPQAGTKHSLNVSVAVGVVLWHFFCHKQS